MNLPPKTLSLLSELIGWIHSLVTDINTQLPRFYLVGGAVRDCLLERSSRDVDLVSPSAELFARLIAEANTARAVRFDKREGDVNFRIAIPSVPAEVLDISQMHGKDIKEDLRVRDFTINAMAVPYQKNSAIEIIDPLDGRADLSRKIIRQTSADSLKQDSIRILRAFRLAAELGFCLDAVTCRDIEEQKAQLPDAAPERIREELFRILRVSGSKISIQRMDEIGVLKEIFPEIQELKGCVQNAHHHLDVWGHSLLVLENCEYITNHLRRFFGEKTGEIRQILATNHRLPLLKMAALFHDVGKPATREIRGKDGRVTFYGHAEKGARQMREIANRLRCSAAERIYLEFLVSEHLHILSLWQPEVKKSTLYRFIRKAGDDFIPLIILGMADMAGKKSNEGKDLESGQYNRWVAVAARRFFDEIKPQLARKALVTGRDILALGVEAGPVIGEILREVQDAQDDGLVTDRASGLAYARRLLNQKRIT